MTCEVLNVNPVTHTSCFFVMFSTWAGVMPAKRMLLDVSIGLRFGLETKVGASGKYRRHNCTAVQRGQVKTMCRQVEKDLNDLPVKLNMPICRADTPPSASASTRVKQMCTGGF